jgi:hypothetical protein
MKKQHKILAIGLICAIPLIGFASGYDKHHDKDHSSHKLSHHSFSQHDKYEDDEDLTLEYLEKKGANLVFEGRIESKPENGLNGLWTISGKKVLVDDKTIIFMEKRISNNDEVEVIAKRENGKIKALLLEQD